MGLLQALYQLGRLQKEADGNADQVVLEDFLEYPLPLPKEGSPEKFHPSVIQVALDVVDPKAIPLDVRGIREIRVAEYPGAPGSEQALIKYMYRSPVGSNVAWSFTPIYPLGKPKKSEDIAAVLMGKDTDCQPGWQTDEKSRFYKLNNRVLKGYESSGYFTAGSVERLMNSLVDRVNELVENWNDPARSTIMTFGVISETGRFVFPGDIPAFHQHFLQRIETELKQTNVHAVCGLCSAEAQLTARLSHLLKFSTFDKPSFLAGLYSGEVERAFPICWNCFAALSRGKQLADNQYATRLGNSGIELQVIPELLGEAGLDALVQQAARKYLTQGVSSEETLLDELSEQGGAFVTHILLTEQNQAQVVLHRLIEDVPPTQFRKIKRLWDAARHKINPNAGDQSLDKAFRQMMAMITGLAGKNESDAKVMRDLALNFIAGLIANQAINGEVIRQIAVARIPTLLFTEEAPSAKKKGAAHEAEGEGEMNGQGKGYTAGQRLEQVLLLTEFASAFNRQISYQEETQP